MIDYIGQVSTVPPNPLPPSPTAVHRQYNEDLFESSKMTFGEHLDELRLALVKTILSFVIGFLVALIFAGQLVDYVQTPLRSALKEYYGTMAERALRKSLTEDGNEG